MNNEKYCNNKTVATAKKECNNKDGNIETPRKRIGKYRFLSA